MPKGMPFGEYVLPGRLIKLQKKSLVFGYSQLQLMGRRIASVLFDGLDGLNAADSLPLPSSPVLQPGRYRP